MTEKIEGGWEKVHIFSRSVLDLKEKTEIVEKMHLPC